MTAYSKARMVNLKNQVYFFKRGTNIFTLSGNIIHAPYIAAWSYSLAQVRGIGDFTALFDQYKITHVQVRFFLRIDPGAQTAATANVPRLYYFTDHDDDTAPSSLDNFREHQRLKIVPLNLYKPVVVNFKPSILTQAFRTTTTVGYCPKWRQWLDMAQTDVPHYGLKWALDDFTNTNYRLDVESTIWFQGRAPR